MNTYSRWNRKKWLLEWFTKYLVDGKPIKLQAEQGRFSRKVMTAQTHPWAFAQNEMGKINIYGHVAIADPDAPTWANKFTKVPADPEAYRKFITSLNFYRNGNLTPGGKPGLNPMLLSGGHKVRIDHDFYTCPRGKYWRKIPAKYNFIYSEYKIVTDAIPARFEFNNGDVWTGD